MKRSFAAFALACSMLGLTGVSVSDAAGLGRETNEVGFRYWTSEYTAGRVSFADVAFLFVDIDPARIGFEALNANWEPSE